MFDFMSSEQSVTDSEYDLISLCSSTFNVEPKDFDPEYFVQCLEEEYTNLSQKTMSSVAQGESRALHWCFTVNNYTEEYQANLRELADDDEVRYLLFGREVGESGTPHLQGFISFVKRTRFSNVVEHLPDSHLEVTRKVQKSITYCKKDGDFEEFGDPPQGPGNRSDITIFKDAVKDGMVDMKRVREEYSEFYSKFPRFCAEYVRDNLPIPPTPSHPLREWQQKLNHDLLLPPNDRTIIFMVDFIGNSGKSWFGRYYCNIHENAQILLPTKKADMAYALRHDIRVLFLDAPRSKQGEFIQYDFLEELKNGYVMSNKYESYVKTFPSMHVVVFMNERPDETKLSRDRYDIRELN
jgi:hypothetical protein